MIVQRTVLDQTEIARDGTIQLRFGMLLVNDDTGEELDCKWLRTAVGPGGDIAGQLEAINVRLTQMGRAAIPDMAGVASYVQGHADLAWTPAVVQAYEVKTAQPKA